MAKLTNFATLFALFLILVANAAYAYRTTITTVEVEDHPDSCNEEIEQNDLTQCKKVITGGALSAILALPGDHGQSEMLRDRLACCRELGQFQRTCVCDALSYIIKKAGGGEDAVSRARNVLIYCRMPMKCIFPFIGR